MIATCRCCAGHEFVSRVIEDSPEINVMEVATETCPVCDTDSFEIVNIEYDDAD
jgi:uncharacterized protein YuzB (UPF0349 family)